MANLGAGLTQGAIALVLITGGYRLALVAGLALLAGGLEAFTSPALRGIVPELVAGTTWSGPTRCCRRPAAPC